MRLMNFSYLIILLSVMISACQEKDKAEKGNEFYKKGEYQKAVELYSEHLRLKPADEIILYNRGRAYEELGQYDQALEDYKKVLKIDPNNESALLSYGKHYFRQKDFENAAYQFEKAYKLNKSSSQAATLLARAYHKSGQLDKAMEFYNIAVNNDKNNGEAHLFRGVLKLHLNQTSAGCNDIKLAVNMNAEGAQEIFEEYCL